MLQDQTQPSEVDISLVGDMSVGKSALIMRLCDDLWQPARLTANTGFDFRTLLHNVNGRQMKLRIWDTAGQERFHAMASMTYRRAQAIILVYSITRRETFDALPGYIGDVETYAHPEAVKIVVGNMLDMSDASRVVTKAEAAKFAADNRCLYAETSALTNEGVTTMFNIVAECVLVTPALSAGRFRDGKSGVELDLHLGANRTITGIRDAIKKTTPEQLAILSALHQLDSPDVYDIRKPNKSSAQVASPQHDKSADNIPTYLASANFNDETASTPAAQDDAGRMIPRSSSPLSILAPPSASLYFRSSIRNTELFFPRPDDSSNSSGWKTVRSVSSRRSSVNMGSIFTMRRHAREQVRLRQQYTRPANPEGSFGVSRSLVDPHASVPRPAARDRSAAYSEESFRTPSFRTASDDISPPPRAHVATPARSSPPLFCCGLPSFLKRSTAVKVDRAVQAETDVVWAHHEEL